MALSQDMSVKSTLVPPEREVPSAASGRSERKNRLGQLAAVVVIVAAFLPFWGDDYYLFLAATTAMYAVALLGLNILTGFNGQLSLGHGAFMAIGGYTAAIMMSHWDLPYWSTIPAAGLICLVLGYLFGFPALRLGGFQLALATFALAVALPQFLKWKYVEEWTGGVQGLLLTKPDAPFGLPLNQDQWLYVFTLAVTIVLFVVGSNLMRGRIGRALLAIREQPTAAVAMGINVAQYKSIAFGISAMYTGIAGALGAIIVQFVSSDTYGFYLSVSLLTGVVVGGLCSIMGSVVGALFIVLVPNVADSISKAAPWAIYGAFLIGTMYLMPEGTAGLLRKIAARLRLRA
jgi:branched-chain amino acid transport system permease protein